MHSCVCIRVCACAPARVFTFVRCMYSRVLGGKTSTTTAVIRLRRNWGGEVTNYYQILQNYYATGPGISGNSPVSTDHGENQRRF